MIKCSDKIYVIDDNEAVCDAIKFIFDSICNISVKIYHNPCVFLDEFSPKWEGCLIIDLFMPAMNGIELITRLKKLNSNLNIITMSGHGTADTASQSIKAGANEFISKPFKTDYLLKKVIHFLK